MGQYFKPIYSYLPLFWGCIYVCRLPLGYKYGVYIWKKKDPKGFGSKGSATCAFHGPYITFMNTYRGHCTGPSVIYCILAVRLHKYRSSSHVRMWFRWHLIKICSEMEVMHSSVSSCMKSLCIFSAANKRISLAVSALQARPEPECCTHVVYEDVGLIWNLDLAASSA